MGKNSNPNNNNKNAVLTKANTNQNTLIIGFLEVITRLPLKIADIAQNQNNAKFISKKSLKH